MGIDRGGMIGVYIKGKHAKREVERECLISTVTGQEFPSDGETKFCPKSGTLLKVKEWKETQDARPSTYIFDDDEEFEGDPNALWTPEWGPWDDATLMIPNDNSLDLDEDGVEFEINGDVDPKEEIEKFKKEYASHIALLVREFGEENIEIKYGFVSYAY